MSKTILCADDSATMQTVAEITFRASPYQYVGARSGAEALDKARASKPALILADAVMPDQTGYDLCQAVKADPSLADVPVILLCGNSQPYDAARGSSVGAAGHFTKPWDTQVLLDKVNEVLGGGAETGAAAARPTPAPRATPTPAAQRPTPAPQAPATQPATPTPPAPVPAVPAAPSEPSPARPSAPAAVQPPRSATIMGMPTIKMPPGGPQPPGVTPVGPSAAPPTPGMPPVTPGIPKVPTRIPTPAPIAQRPAAEARPSTPAVPTRPSAPSTPATPPAPAASPATPPPAAARPEPAPPQPIAPEPPTRPAAPAAQTRPAPRSPSVAPEPLPRPPAGMARPPMIKGTPRRAPSEVAAAVARARAALPRSAARVAREAGIDLDGPEMQAILKLSHDVVERVVWEVVPDLAETIIRENLEALAAKAN